MDFLQLGNHPFLDFINTRPVVNGQPVELLGDGSALLNLLGRLGLPETGDLSRRADAEIHAVANDARALREDFRRLLIRLKDSDGSRMDESTPELLQVNAWVGQLGLPNLTKDESAFAVKYTQGSISPWIKPLLLSALDLLASSKFARIKKCSDPDCVLWYVDTTKSQTRHWCSMSICGNVNKARAYRQRQREQNTHV